VHCASTVKCVCVCGGGGGGERVFGGRGFWVGQNELGGGGVGVWWWCYLSESVFSLCYSGMSRHWRLVVSPCDVL